MNIRPGNRFRYVGGEGKGLIHTVLSVTAPHQNPAVADIEVITWSDYMPDGAAEGGYTWLGPADIFTQQFTPCQP